MTYFVVFIVFCLGTIIGSFLNVVILRLNTGASLSGRSRCFTCGMQLRWYDLVPVLSFAVLRGRCRLCRSTISWQYFSVEILTGILFLGTFYKTLLLYKSAHIGVSETILLTQLPWVSIGFYFVVWSMFVVIAVYDIRHKMIPDGFVYSLALLALARIATEFFVGNSTFVGIIGPLFIGPLLALPFFLIWFFSRGRAMGFGDVKLALALGWLLSWSQALAVFILAFWFGGAVGIVLLFVVWLPKCLHSRRKLLSLERRSITIKSEIPFAPFLILGIVAMFFCNLDIYTLVSFFERIWA